MCALAVGTPYRSPPLVSPLYTCRWLYCLFSVFYASLPRVVPTNWKRFRGDAPNKRLRAVRMLVHLLLIERTLFGSFAASKKSPPPAHTSPLTSLTNLLSALALYIYLERTTIKGSTNRRTFRCRANKSIGGRSEKKRGEADRVRERDRERRRIYANCE